MLCLRRKLGQSIVIDDNITIQVLDLRRNTVQLGITAPDTITVHREEIYNEILLAPDIRVAQALNDLTERKLPHGPPHHS